MTIWLQKQPNGDLINWGRHGRNRCGGAVMYTGEHAKIMRLVIASMKGKL